MQHTLDSLQAVLDRGADPLTEAAIKDAMAKLKSVNRLYVDMMLKHDALLTQEAQRLDQRIYAETDPLGGVRFYANTAQGRITSVSAHMVKAQLDRQSELQGQA